MGDNTDNPLFIETVPKQGYRFIALLKVRNPPTRTHLRRRQRPQFQRSRTTLRILSPSRAGNCNWVHGIGGCSHQQLSC
jgi:DNA-binding winged helix-turn-helix (wHTH) protein